MVTSKNTTSSIVTSLNSFETVLTLAHETVKGYSTKQQKNAHTVAEATSWWESFMANDIEDPELERLFYQGFVVKLAIRVRRVSSHRPHG